MSTVFHLLPFQNALRLAYAGEASETCMVKISMFWPEQNILPWGIDIRLSSVPNLAFVLLEVVESEVSGFSPDANASHLRAIAHVVEPTSTNRTSHVTLGNHSPRRPQNTQHFVKCDEWWHMRSSQPWPGHCHCRPIPPKKTKPL